jgi:hypothetical protein
VSNTLEIKNKMDILVRTFFLKRAISTDIELNDPLYNAIFFLEKSNIAINDLCKKHLSKLECNVAWPSMHDMYKRSYEYCCGALSCFLVAQFPSSEALCRTAIEGAVNLHYISIGDSLGKQIAYFKNYLEIERKQNRNWKSSVENSQYPTSAKNHHYERIDQKDKALDQYDKMLRESFKLDGVAYDSSNLKWPSIFDRFKEIADEVGYRTVYSALCSQAHNDAEDILNLILSRAVDNVDGLDEAQIVEQYCFSLYMLLTAIQYHIRASAMYIAKFEINASDLMEIWKKTVDTAIAVIESGPQLISEKIKINIL